MGNYWTTSQHKLAATADPAMVAAAIGKTRAAVWAYRSSHGLSVTPRYYTQQDDELIRSMRADGCTFAYIGQIIGRTEKSVLSRNKKLIAREKKNGCTNKVARKLDMIYGQIVARADRRRFTDYEDAQIKQMREQSMTHREIAAHIRRNVDSVRARWSKIRMGEA